jgi:maltose alpha-D-glucosyltransferase/alpha-amylase
MLKEPPELAKQMIGSYLSSAELLGQRTAELHMALASVTDDPDFAPEPFTFMYQTSLYQAMRGFTTRTLQTLRERVTDIPEEIVEDVQRVLGMEREIIDRYRLIQKNRISAMRMRCHGDYHLGQVLYTGKDFVIIDFEGEPARSLSERRLKRSPLRDVASMIRSFHYATHNALLRYAPSTPSDEGDMPVLRHWAQFWYVWVSVTFLTFYFNTIEKSGLLPESPDQQKILLDAYLLDKAVYEISYELNNRPNWLRVPLNGILQLLED